MTNSIDLAMTPLNNRLNSVNELMAQADFHISDGNYNRVLEELNRATSLRPDWFLPYFARGLV